MFELNPVSFGWKRICHSKFDPSSPAIERKQKIFKKFWGKSQRIKRIMTKVAICYNWNILKSRTELISKTYLGWRSDARTLGRANERPRNLCQITKLIFEENLPWEGGKILTRSSSARPGTAHKWLQDFPAKIHHLQVENHFSVTKNPPLIFCWTRRVA